uniref:Ig-like domain-containing protein n=1 Tax=Acanthochromis polyacanthus TaxID=80966 RepID=A0A3Q1F4C4_9TELE
MDGLFVKAPLRTIAGLVLLVYYCRGQSQLIGQHEPIIARVGDDVILPCHLNPVMDVVGRTLEWSRSDRNNMFVYVWRSGQEFEKVKHSSYVGRTSLFIDQLSHGNISLKLSKLKLSDRGTYRCFIVDDKKQTFIQLIVGTPELHPGLSTTKQRCDWFHLKKKKKTQKINVSMF